MKKYILFSFLFLGWSFYASSMVSSATVEAPTLLTSEILMINQMKLSWQDNSDEDNFVVERAENYGNFSILATLQKDTTSYIDNTAYFGTIYSYRVYAVKDTVKSLLSNQVSDTISDTVKDPDFFASELEFPKEVFVGETVKVKFVFENNGEGPVSLYNIALQFLPGSLDYDLEDIFYYAFSEQETPKVLYPGDKFTVSIDELAQDTPWIYKKAGEYVIKVVVDAEDLIFEPSEVNNSLSGTITVKQGTTLGEEDELSDDTDGDGLSNKTEIDLGLDWKSADSDKDLLFDGEEVLIYKTNPLKKDSDGDSYEDGDEVVHGYNPLGNGKLDILQQNDPVGIDKSENVSQTDPNILKYVRGKIMLAVEAHGEAYYVNPSDGNGYYLGHADDAYQIMRNLSLGITDANLGKIPVAGTSDAGDLSLRQRLAGKILLAVESHGEAWYVHPVTLQRHYLGRAEDAYQIMREQGVGISNENLKRLRKVY